MRLFWTRVASLDEIEPGGGLLTLFEGRPVVVFRTEEGVRAIDARCPHQAGTIAPELVKGTLAVCPSHGWAFDVRTGRHVLFRGVGVPVFRTRVRDGGIYLRSGTLRALSRAVRAFFPRPRTPTTMNGSPRIPRSKIEAP